MCAGQRALLTMLGVKGSQVQILSARQNVAGDLRKRRSPFVAQGRPPRIPRLERRRVALAAARTCTCAGWRCGECARSCDAAWTEVARPEDGPDGLADSCTPSYIGMEAAACWGALRRTGAHWGALGRFDAAITTYERSLQAWPDRLRRDQGLCLAACQRLCGPRRRGASMPGWSSGGRRHSGGNIQPGAERGAACPGAPGAVAPACGSIGARRPDPRLAVPGRVARGGRSVD